MCYNQTVVIDFGHGQHCTYPNQEVEIVEYADVIFGVWNGKLVAAFYNENNMAFENTWHAAV